MTVSIIVPVYNVERYLSRCVDSILAQTFTDFELILVDDGSPDKCPAMCDEYAAQDSRIKVIHKPNGGLSGARNAGLDVAAGEYVLFVDSDDYVSPQLLEKTYQIAKRYDSNMVVYDFTSVYADGRSNVRISNMLEPVEQWEIDDFWRHYYYDNGLPYSIAWNKLYKRSLFDRLRFEMGKIHEDEFILYDVIKATGGKITLLNESFYFYYHHIASITGNHNYKGAVDAVTALLSRAKAFENDGFRQYCGLSLRHALVTLQHYFTVSAWNKKDKAAIMQMVKKTVREFKFSSAWPLKIKMAVALCKIHPMAYFAATKINQRLSHRD